MKLKVVFRIVCVADEERDLQSVLAVPFCMLRNVGVVKVKVDSMPLRQVSDGS